jgi:hypothetical protein
VGQGEFAPEHPGSDCPVQLLEHDEARGSLALAPDEFSRRCAATTVPVHRVPFDPRQSLADHHQPTGIQGVSGGLVT